MRIGAFQLTLSVRRLSCWHKEVTVFEEYPERNNLYPNLTSERLLFVHIPKNYGTSITMILFNTLGAQSHLTMSQINTMKQFENYKGFCFVRDPVKRFVSVYLWRARKDPSIIDPSKPFHTMGMVRVLEKIDNKNIQQPLKACFDDDPLLLSRMFLKQSTWVNENVVFIGKCENFVSDLLELKSKYDIKFSTSDATTTAVNRQSHGIKLRTEQEFREIMKKDKKLRNQFLDYYQEDYDRFDYKIDI